jgi:hypothetical protein
MVLIPSDIGVRLRLQNEALLLQPAAPVTEIPSDLPALRQGQTFSARIQEALPENTYKALVAGKSLTLSLPEGAKPGDTLELVVIDRSPKVVVAQLANPGATPETPQAYPFTNLSRAGQLIGSLLPAEGETPAAVTLGRGQPLLSQPPLSGSQLAPVLADAVKSSGLFYESHQAQWVTGRLPLAQLMLEPQAQHSNPATLLAAGIPPATNFAQPEQSPEKSADRRESLQGLAGRQTEPANLIQTLLGRDSNSTVNAETEGLRNSSNPASAPAIASSSKSIPEELRPIIQQQLDAVATQRLAWHGEVWPQQTLDWEVQWEHGQGSPDDDEPSLWTTNLSLTTPRLGEVNARLQLTKDGVRIALLTPYGASAADLRDAAPDLEQSLAAAGVPLLGFLVKHDDQGQ